MSAAKVEERMLLVEVVLPVAGLQWSVPLCLRFLLRLLPRDGFLLVACGFEKLKVLKAVLWILLQPVMEHRPAGNC